jgi:hypothetical protein
MEVLKTPFSKTFLIFNLSESMGQYQDRRAVGHD